MRTHGLLVFAALFSLARVGVLNAETPPISNPGCLVILFEATPMWATTLPLERDRLLLAHRNYWTPIMQKTLRSVPSFRVTGLSAAPYAEAIITSESNPDYRQPGYLRLAGKDPAVAEHLFSVRTFNLLPIGAPACVVLSKDPSKPPGA